MIYQDKQITITKDFIRVNDFEIEAIAISTIKKAYVKAQVIGDFKNVAIMFFVLGILSIWFLIGFVFIALGIGA